LSNFGRIVFDTVGAAGFALPCFDVVTLGIRKGTDAEEPCNRCQTVSVPVFASGDLNQQETRTELENTGLHATTRQCWEGEGQRRFPARLARLVLLGLWLGVRVRVRARRAARWAPAELETCMPWVRQTLLERFQLALAQEL
jgi:hypothetical protein